MPASKYKRKRCSPKPGRKSCGCGPKRKRKPARRKSR